MTSRFYLFSMKNNAAKAFLVSLFLFYAFVTPNFAQKLNLRGLETYIEQERVKWQVPGLAVAMVKDDSVIFAKGFGVREIGKPALVDEHTLFAIASNTKAFTAALLGMLMDEGKLKWDDPVIKYLTGFQLSDPYVTRELTIRDLLCHRSGLPVFGGDHLWIGSPLTRDEVIRRLRFLAPSAPFRTRYQYQNLMFVTAGQIIPAVTGKNWEEFLQERILTPLAMNESTTSMAALRARENVAIPHEPFTGKVAPVAYDHTDNSAPAGAIKSNVLDMTKWMRLHLNLGMHKGTRMLSERVARDMQTVQTPIRVSAFAQEKFHRSFDGYGLGWHLQDYKGHKIVSHGGGLSGMFSLQTLLPDKKFGVIILTNFAPHDLTTALTYRILDAVLNEPAYDWSAWFLKFQTEEKEQARKTETELQAKRVKDTKPSLDLAAYVGKYFEDFSGPAEVRMENGMLVFDYNPRHRGTMAHWHYDTFRITWSDPIYDMPRQAFLTFYLDESGKVKELLTTFYDPITFKRVVDEKK